jgi:two-component system cell cycle sensor histidine kinase/response regulator CckA
VGQGTGLGLAVVHGIVEQSGGHLEACSLPGVGTTFKVYLPALEEPAQTGSERVPAKPPAGRGETVLLVEDEDAVRAVSVLLLESLGYRVLEAASAEEALRLVEAGRQKLDLLLTDVVVPGRNGQEPAEALRRWNPGLKALFQSGYTGEAVAGHGLVEAEMAFLQKPFTLDSLAKKVRAVLDEA